jgi:isoaspartyl peptidase/L-asparaginase-like protein (Ntn-hydrolase superfamily)
MTGLGERIMVRLSAKRLCDLVDDGRDLASAARAVMEELDRVRGSAGLIAVDGEGRIEERRNTAFMASARRGG